MGEGFYSPVDDMGPDREAKSPEVLEALADAWQKGGYDIRWLFRTILNTRAYQREIRSTYTAAGRTPFASNCPSRLRSDQILDSLNQVLELHRVGRRRRRRGHGQGGRQGGGQGGREERRRRADQGPGGDQRRGAEGRPRRAGPVQHPLRRRPVDPQRRHPGHDPAGPLPDEQPAAQPRHGRRRQDRPRPTSSSTTPDNRQALWRLYVRVLARGPTAKEQQTCGRYIDAVGDRQRRSRTSSGA